MGVGTLDPMTLAAALGGPELLIILVIALLLFGGTQLPKLARSLGQAQQEFKKGTDGEPEPAKGDDSKA
jgi:sec-independent protein translocase protein TatA